MKPADETPHINGRVSARVIHAFGPIVREAMTRERFYAGAFFVYPAEDGALCIATDGRVFAAFHDRTARMSTPAVFLLPDALIDACAPPPPLVGSREGEERLYDLPDWTQPEFVFLSSAGAFVLPKSPHPDDAEKAWDAHCLHTCIAQTEFYGEGVYRAEVPSGDMRSILSILPGEPTPIVMDPRLVGLFAHCVTSFGAAGTVHFRTNGPTKPISILLSDAPDFIGLIAPMRPDSPPPLPAFVTALRAAAPADLEPRAA